MKTIRLRVNKTSGVCGYKRFQVWINHDIFIETDSVVITHFPALENEWEYEMELHKEGDFVGRINISADEYNSITYEKNINCETFADDKTYYSIDMEMLKKQQELLWQKIKR